MIEALGVVSLAFGLIVAAFLAAQFSRSRLYCRMFHRSLMFVGGDVAECRVCGRPWPCPWSDKGADA